MKFTDILHLTWKEITGDTILFQRQKTIKTHTDITVRINETMKTILERWASDRKSGNNLVFPFLNGMNSLEKRTA